MQTLTDFLTHFDGLRPRLVRKALLGGTILSKEERDDLRDDVCRVGAKAAAAIREAYLRGALPMKPGVEPKDSKTVTDYIARLKELEAIASAMTEAELATSDKLDTLFFELAGPGSRTMTIAGREVTKHLLSYSSNSGKSTGYYVGFSWIGSDGELKRREGILPSEAHNRRNDSARNWGLPE